jgi:hypothetical protein
MKPWTLIESTGGRPGTPGGSWLRDFNRTLESARRPQPAPGRLDALRRSCRDSGSRRRSGVIPLRLPTWMTLQTTGRVVTAECARLRERSDGGS